MEYGIGHLSIVPMRREASDASEQVSQLLFGETLAVIEKFDKWSLVATTHDGYRGFVDNKQFTLISDELFDQQTRPPLRYVRRRVVSAHSRSSANRSEEIPLVFGSVLPGYDHDSFEVGEREFQFYAGGANASDDPSWLPNPSEPFDAILTDAIRVFMNAPYQWGGRSPFGVDCSGFTQMVYRMHGIPLLRDASQQAEMGNSLVFLEEARSGDLAFFDNDEGKIIHVGMLLTDKRIIHASGNVRVDTIDHQGIYNQQMGKYTHRLRLLKRLVARQ